MRFAGQCRFRAFAGLRLHRSQPLTEPGDAGAKQCKRNDTRHFSPEQGRVETGDIRKFVGFVEMPAETEKRCQQPRPQAADDAGDQRAGQQQNKNHLVRDRRDDEVAEKIETATSAMARA